MGETTEAKLQNNLRNLTERLLSCKELRRRAETEE